MAIDRSTLTRQQQEWINTIEADPDLFLALAEESGLAAKLRRRLNEPTHGQAIDGPPQKNDGQEKPRGYNSALQQLADQRNALARAIVQNAQGAGIHEQQSEGGEKQPLRMPMRMVELIRVAHELGDRAIQGNQAIRQRQALTSRLYEAGQSAGLVDATPNPDSPATLQSMDTHAIINGLSDAAAKGKRATEQRDRLATSVAEAAQSAGLITPGAELTGPQLLLLINDMGMAAKATVGRNEMLAKLEQSGDRIITDADAMEAIERLDKSYYRRWREDTMAGSDRQGYVSGNIQAGDLGLVVEYARRQLIEHAGMQANQDQSEAPEITQGLSDALKEVNFYSDVWRNALADGDGENGFLTGPIPAEHLIRVIEFAEQAATTPARKPELDNLIEWWSHLEEDYRKYASGDPTVPFSSFRQTLDQFIDAMAATDLKTLDSFNNTPKEANPASVPEVTDNVMRKANRAIGELTGNKHIAVTAKVVNAVWDALNEDATPTNKPTPEPQLSDTARRHYEQLERTYFAIQHGDHTLTDADFKKHLEQFAAAVVDSGIARPIELGQPSAVAPGVMDEQQKAQINNALDILYRVGPSGITSPGAMATLQAMVKSYADPRTPDDKQAAEDDQNTLNTFLDDDYEDEGLSPRMG